MFQRLKENQIEMVDKIVMKGFNDAEDNELELNSSVRNENTVWNNTAMIEIIIFVFKWSRYRECSEFFNIVNLHLVCIWYAFVHVLQANASTIIIYIHSLFNAKWEKKGEKR